MASCHKWAQVPMQNLLHCSCNYLCSRLWATGEPKGVLFIAIVLLLSTKPDNQQCSGKMFPEVNLLYIIF